MLIRVPVETILASFLFLSRVSSRHSDVICGRGLGEGDKWFDGCQWCLCQRSGPLCSPAPCADLATRIPPCETIGSRWWDGCYRCTCRHDGIECIADQTCVMLMTNKPYMKEILGLSPCTMLKDNRCICGVDGIPSCSAEVIDRKSFRATTIGLEASFPSSTRLLTPRATHFNAVASRTDNSKSSLELEQRQHHHRRVVRRHEGAYRTVRPENSHSDRYFSYSRRKRRSTRSFRGSFPTLDYVRARTRSSLDGASSQHSGKHDIRAPHSRRGWDEWSRELSLQHDQRRELRNPHAGTRSALRDSQERTRKHGKWDLGDRQERQSSKHRRGYRRKSEYRDRIEERQERQVPVSTAGFLRDDPRNVHIPSSVLVASDNRCRYGVRWYGGGLRCYCDADGSITCGEPNFVASRIDGFRLKMSDCEEGHVWEDESSCRVCQCRQSGLMECRRSPSCPLPYLVQPLAAEWQEDGLDDLGDRKFPQKRIGEFRGQEEDEIDWSKVYSRLGGFDEEGRNTGKNNLYGVDNDDEDEDDDDESLREHMLSSSELDGSGELLRSGDEEQTDLNEDIPDQRVYPDKPDRDRIRGSGNEDFVVLNVDPWKKELIVDSDNENDDIFTNVARNDKTRRTNVHYKQDNPRAGADDDINLSRRNENGYDSIKTPKVTYGNDIGFSKDRNNQRTGKGKSSNEFENNSSKGTTVVIVRECRPHSRWMAGCLRCHCSSKGQKICDDSRCLKAELATVSTSKDSVIDEGKRYPRPMQRPPVLAMARNTPIQSRLPGKLTSPCGRFKISQVYWVDCNLCYCTPHGPKCTAKNCG